MKKWSYLLSGLLIGLLVGVVVATAGSTFADQIKSMVGQTVAGEYSVKVNGNSLPENAIVVDGKAHVPLRAVSDSLGASLKVEGKTVEITAGNTAETPTTTNSSDKVQTQLNEKSKSEKLIVYSESDKSFYETLLNQTEDRKVKLQKYVDNIRTILDQDPERYEHRLKTIEEREAEIVKIDKEIEEYKAKIAEVEENLAKYKNYR